MEQGLPIHTGELGRGYTRSPATPRASTVDDLSNELVENSYLCNQNPGSFNRKTLKTFYQREVLNNSDFLLTYRMETGHTPCRSHNPRRNTSFRKQTTSRHLGQLHTTHTNKNVQHNSVAKTNKLVFSGKEGDTD